jgi:hypothetical protein
MPLIVKYAHDGSIRSVMSGDPPPEEHLPDLTQEDEEIVILDESRLGDIDVSELVWRYRLDPATKDLIRRPDEEIPWLNPPAPEEPQ